MADLAFAEELFKKAEEKEGIGLELLEEGDSFLGLGWPMRKKKSIRSIVSYPRAF